MQMANFVSIDDFGQFLGKIDFYGTFLIALNLAVNFYLDRKELFCDVHTKILRNYFVICGIFVEQELWAMLSSGQEVVVSLTQFQPCLK